jgi:hypothetical protein
LHSPVLEILSMSTSDPGVLGCSDGANGGAEAASDGGATDVVAELLDAGAVEDDGATDEGRDSGQAARLGAPIHELLVEHCVSILFQGHDHVYAHQALDGVLYLTCPMPADPGSNLYNADAFLSGETLPNGGHLRITVAPAGVRVDYV